MNRLVCMLCPLLAALAACGDPVAPAPPPQIRALVQRVVEGDTVRLLAEPGGAGVAWRSSAPGIAAVDADGLVRGVSPGWALVTAERGGRADSIHVGVVLRFASIGPDSCGLAPAGELYCWGPVPERRFPSHRFAQVAGGSVMSCGIATDGALFCWGENYYGHLGIGTSTACGPVGSRCEEPQPVMPGTRFRGVSVPPVGYHACAVTEAGEAYCWGMNDRQQLGAPAPDRCGGWPCARAPVRVAADVHFRGVAAGDRHTCAVDTSDAAWCWGDNSVGQLGIGTVGGTSDRPVVVRSGLRFDALEAGWGFVCGRTADDAVHCWGRNDGGQIGVGRPGSPCYLDPQSCFPLPVAVSGGLSLHALSVGAFHACGLDASDRSWCWGDGKRTPALLQGAPAFRAIEARPGGGCGLTRRGAAFCWGSGDLGAGIDRLERGVPVPVAPPGPLPAALRGIHS